MLKGDHTQSHLISEAKQGWAEMGSPLGIACAISLKKERERNSKGTDETKVMPW